MRPHEKRSSCLREIQLTPKNIIIMGEKKYSDPEEKVGVEMCSEPSVTYAATGSGYANTTYEDEEENPQIPVGKLGFYTDDPVVFEARVAEIEADLAEVESGVDDPQKWATSEQFDQELYQQFPWLR